MVTKTTESYPAVDLVRKDPKTAAMLSKTIANHRQNNSRDAQGNRKTLLPHSYSFKNKLQKRAKRNNDAKMILQLLPDLELAIQILTSSILSPADMTSTELNYISASNLFTSELSSSMITCIKGYFEEDYKIKPLLPKMLRDILAEKGSYPIAVIPENVIDDFINGDKFISLESLNHFVDDKGLPKNVGILGSPTESTKNKLRGLALEEFSSVSKREAIDTRLHIGIEDESTGKIKSYYTDEYTTVTDNIMVLKFPKLNERLKHKAITKAMGTITGGFSLESVDKVLNDFNIEQMIYKPRQFQSEHVATLKQQSELSRHSVGNPLIMKLPTECCIPVHVPGNVEKHIGYFVILDEEGNPIESIEDSFYYSATSKGLDSGSKNSLSSNILNRINTNIGAANQFDPSNVGHLDFAAQVYADMVERDLIARIKNGVHSNSAQIAKNEEIYRIMLSRAFSRKYTQILYIPIEYMTYITFKYGDDGIGKSLLDDASTINTLRSVMVFSDVIASIKNSIGRTKVTMELPEDDPNPLKTIEMAQEEIVRSRQLGIPLGVTNASDITDFIQRAGYEWAFSGHPGLPELKFEFDNTSSSIVKPDSDLQDHLRKSSIMAMGLSPETVDNGFNTEFATTAVQNNILLSKRIMQYQELFCPAISDHLRKVAFHSEKLVSELRTILEENIKNIKLEIEEADNEMYAKLPEESKNKLLITRALNEFLAGFEVWLPKPPSVTLENQLAELKTYIEALDEGINAYISGDFMTDTTAGGLSDKIDTIKGMIKAYYIRKWLADKGVLTELSELTATAEDGNPQLDLLKETTNHIESLTRSCVTAISKLAPIAAAATSDLEAMGTPDGEESTDSGSSSTDDDSEGSSGTDDDFGSLDMPEEPESTNTDETPPTDSSETPTDEKPAGEEDEPKADL